MWNVYNQVLNDQGQTNNHAEAAHRRVQAELEMDHSMIWKLIDGLWKVQKGRDLFCENSERWSPTSPEKEEVPRLFLGLFLLL